ncbi:putative OPT family oligopeptide transporter [Ereboglobus sp. PH5-5]|uniref:Oligopeptide transporter, OPT family n=1 Tax=Ereboglobus luteus TaxID=1796921 RepID=A0A2U8E2H8_9BACT|nr:MULTISPECIES: oligopeptide transporter, OPT family [Ereboglobus]AWI09010.1 oligopeptide transporter, OPT family [Ereboglobus luteus]MDF9828399.1 putative OPT family oligopeptide transporter [Ereboglobus sp. PH5-10]MDF9834307.1 putative OPT family oligopeptide transporter [Ereboglobus sp. PH5-5]
MSQHQAPQPFEPYIPDNTKLPEFTLRAVLTGAILGMVFGASSLYLVLKVGLTVSASIPVAVISLALFRGLSKLGVRDSSILENNITQTAGSAGESIAFGVGVTMPAIFILGFDLELTRVMLVAILGGLLGILMMIPLRRTHIVEDHGKLKYPEGTACAAVLKAGANARDRAVASPSAQADMRAAEAAGLGNAPGAIQIFTGFGIGLVYKTLNVAMRGWQDIPQKIFGKPLAGGSISAEVSPELLGVGYIIGPRISGIMCAGGALSYLVLIPLIKFFGDGINGIVEPGTIPISEMPIEGANSIRDAYILYIGAGAVASAGIISMVQAMPAIWRGIKAGFADIRGMPRPGENAPGKNGSTARTQRDLPMKTVFIGILALIAVISLAPSLHMNVLGALLIVLFGFLFVTVSSRITGEIGSTSNPVSGMTVATLLFTCLVFLIVGWTGSQYYVTALSVGAIVCIAASNGGTTSQDLKTGFLLGATPRSQQLAILIGAFAAALVLGPLLSLLNNGSTVYVPVAQVAPAGIQVDVSALSRKESLHGPQSRDDSGVYYTWHNTDPKAGIEGKYLVNEKGVAVWFVDPGINGSFDTRPDGSKVRKFVAPKATLMSYIIKGILDQRLPWALVLLGVMITVTLQLSFIPALAFAVGVYLPLSSTTPILAGGMIRWLIDRWMSRKSSHANLTPEQFNAESDKSPGVLLSSGYIAGGAIGGIVFAVLAGFFPGADNAIATWAQNHNPLYNGPHAGLLSLIPFALLAIFLYGVAREWFLSPRKK